MAHTPGPWTLERVWEGYLIHAPSAGYVPSRPIATVKECRRADAEAAANARLIAAAPELLEQLNIASGWIGTEIINIGPCDHGVGICTCGDRAMLADIRAAIAKATGGES